MYLKVIKWFDKNRNVYHYPRLIEDTNDTGVGVSTRKKITLFVGLHNSGKTRMLNRLFERANDVWKRQFSKIQKRKKNMNILFISAKESVSIWRYKNGVKEKSIEGNEKLEELSKDAIIFIDDIDKMTDSAKTQMLKRMMANAFRIVASAKDEMSINPSLRHFFWQNWNDKENKVQLFRLSSEKMSYDYTHHFIWVLATIFAISGNFEIVAILMGLKLIGGIKK